MSSVRSNSHFHYVTLPSGRRVQTTKEMYEMAEVSGLDDTTYPAYDKSKDPIAGKKWDAFGIAANLKKTIIPAAEKYAKTFGYSKQNPPPKAMLIDYFKRHTKPKTGLDKVGDAIKKVALPVLGAVVGSVLLPGAGTLIGGAIGTSASAAIGSAISEGTKAVAVAKDALESGKKIASTATQVIDKAQGASKDEVKKLLSSVAPQVLNEVRQAIQEEKVAKVVEDQKVAKIVKATSPSINSIYRKLQKDALQKQATSEHVYRNKINKVIADNRKNQNTLAKSQVAVLKKLNGLEKKLLKSASKQRAVSAAFGVPLVYT